MSTKKRVLITGAAGFIGSHLCDYYLAKGWEVIGIDNFITGSKKNINHLANETNFHFIQQDVSHKITINQKLDYILHFASPASPKYYHAFPLETMFANSLGALEVIKLAIKNSATLLIASTSEVYGDPLCNIQHESYYGNVNPVGPRSVYDESKRFQETLCIAYHKVKQLKLRIVRIFNTFGPRMSITDGRVIPEFISQIINKQPLSIYGDGDQTRCFCFISDLLLGIDKLLHTDYSLPVNIGNDQQISILKLAQEMIDVFNHQYGIQHSRALPKDDPKTRKPAIQLAKKLLGWQPIVGRKEGLEKTYKYFIDNKQKT